MKLDVGIMVGNDSKTWLSDLTKVIDRLEKMVAKLGLKSSESEETETEEEEEDAVPAKAKRGRPPGKAKAEEEEEEEAEESEEEEDPDFAPKKKKAKGKSFEDEEEEAEEAEESEEEEEAPKKKSKKVTLEDVNEAAKAAVRALTEEGETGPVARKTVLKLLKKKFDVDSVTDLEPELYAAAIKALKG